MGEAQPTRKDYQAADEAIARYSNPHPNPRVQEARRNVLAYCRARWGRDKFRLRQGLRAPRNPAEELEFRFFLGDLDKRQFRRLMKAEALRDVDERMLRDFETYLERLLKIYSRFLIAVVDRATKYRHGRIRWQDDEPVFARLVEKLDRKSNLDKRQLEKLFEFLQEARMEQGLNLAEAGSYRETAAHSLVYQVRSDCRSLWEAACATARRSRHDGRYLRTVGAAQLFYEAHLSGLPRPQVLSALVRQEILGGIRVLRSTVAANPMQTEVGRVEVRAGMAVIHASAVEVYASAVIRQKAGKRKTTSPALQVRNWGQLGLGVNYTGNVFAIAPLPALGSRLKRRQAHKLSLSGKRWQVVLGLLAESPDGQTLQIHDLRRAQGQLPPVPRMSAGRADREGLTPRRADKRPVRNLVSDLNRQLRDLVSCDSNEGPLSVDGDVVRSRFTAQYLIPTSDRGRTFGPPRSKRG